MKRQGSERKTFGGGRNDNATVGGQASPELECKPDPGESACLVDASLSDERNLMLITLPQEKRQKGRANDYASS